MNLLPVVIWGTVVFTLLGIFFGFALAATAKRFAVVENPLIEKVRGFLPSANCGACGFAGCQAYAEEVVENKKVSPSLCIPGGSSVSKEVASLTDKAPETVEDRIVVLRCHGTTAYVQQQATYEGILSCAGASLVFGGPKACKNGCLGLGDCLRVCPFDAIHIGRSGIIEIDPKKCTGCALCVPACPKKILELYPRTHRVELSCVAREKASAVRAKCLIGCTTCQKCVSACPAQALSFDGMMILIDHKKCVAYGPECNEACVTICPTFVLHRIGQNPLPEEMAKFVLPGGRG